MTLTYGSVCSGMEAASLAWQPLGWRCAFVSEIDKAPSALLARRITIADGPRYKMIGNSWAVPVVRWIGNRIAQVDACLKAERDDTINKGVK